MTTNQLSETHRRYTAFKDIERWYALGMWRVYPIETLERIVRTLERAEGYARASERKKANAAKQRRVVGGGV